MERTLVLENYKSIRHCSVRFSGLTVLVGLNGAGKSNFADALILVSRLERDEAAAITERGGARRLVFESEERCSIELTTGWKGLEARLETSIVVGADGQWRFDTEKLETERATKSRHGTVVTDTEGDGFDDFPENRSICTLPLFNRDHVTSGLFDAKRLRINLDELRRPQVPGPAAMLEENGRNVASVVRSLDANALQAEIVDPLAALMPGLTGLTVEETAGYLHLVFHVGRATRNALQVSDGVLSALAIFVGVWCARAGQLLVLEEPEIHLHPGACRVLYDVLSVASDRRQVDLLVTTHSPDLLDAARDENILVCSMVNGETRVGQMADAQRDLVRRGLFSLGELAQGATLRIEGAELPTVHDGQ